MYGLHTRTALSRKQTQWNRGKNNASNKTALNRLPEIEDFPENPSANDKKSSGTCLSTGKNQYLQSNNNAVFNVPEKIGLLEDNTELPPVSDNNFVIKLLESFNRWSEQITYNINTIGKRMDDIEHSISLLINKMSKPSDPESDDTKYIPFFIKEDYAGCDNFTSLEDNHLTMLVEILGHTSDEWIIYPFGTKNTLPNFKETKVKLIIKEDNIDQGIAHGLLTRRADNVYIINVEELYIRGSFCKKTDCILPISLYIDLTLE